jgi:predicted aconitase with swiveling domain
VGSYTLYRLKTNGLAPAAIVNAQCETITAVGCIIAGIPCVDQIPIEQLQTDAILKIDGAKGSIDVLTEMIGA